MKKNALISSILTIAMCFSIISGSTYALFTSESEVNVAITAANVDVTATVEDISLSSTIGENLAETSATFNEEDGTLTLSKIVPGDVVTFNLVVKNKSDVGASFRTGITKVSDSGLWDGLVVTIDGKSYGGEAKLSAWESIAPGSDDIVIPVTVTLPEDAGNEYRAKTCVISYKIEAVQGNVDTSKIVATEISAALKSGNAAYLSSNLSFDASVTEAHSAYGKTGLEINGGVFDGQGYSLIVDGANGTWDSAIIANAGVIKNVNVSGAFRGIFMGSATGDVVIENCILGGDGTVYTFNSDGGSKDYSVTIINSTLNGWTSFSDVHKSVEFIGCTFGEGSGYAFCRPYNDSVFVNCTFEEGFEFDTTKASEIVFINCYYGDTLITSENAANLGNDETTFFYNGLGGLNIAQQISNKADLEDALANGGYVILSGDVETEATTTAPYGNKVAFIQNGGVLDGNGNTITVDCYGDDYGVMTSGGTIKNLTIDSACRAIMIMSPTEDVILDNVYVCGDVLYAINTGEHATVDGLTFTVTNSTFGGWSSFDAGFESASFTDCDFIQGGYEYGWPYDSLVKPYIDTVFTNCDFALDEDGNGYYLDLSALGADCKVTLRNCTVNGTVITADNVDILGDSTDFFGIELPSGRTLEDCVIFE